METKNEIKKELEELSPFLAQFQTRDSGFRTPKNYFKDLPDTIIGKIQAEEQASLERPKSTSGWLESLLASLQWLPQPRYAFALASVTIAIVAALWILRSPFFKGEQELAWNDIPTEEIDEYIADNLQDFEMDLLIEFAPDLEEQNVFRSSEIQEEAIDAYLDEIIEDLDIEDLENLF